MGLVWEPRRRLSAGARSGQLLALLALLGWLFAGSAEASVEEVGGGAFGESVDVVLGAVTARSGPRPLVTLPAEGGGPFTATQGSVDVSAGGISVLSTGVLTVTTEGGDLGTHQGFATSSAQVDGVTMLSAVFSADQISTTCTSNGDGSTGSAAFTNAALDGITIDADIAPNSSIAVAGVGTFLFNEQVVTEAAGSQTSITVNALRVTLDPLLGSGEIIIAQSTCSALGPDVLAPPPDARDDTAATVEGDPVTIDVLANDVDPDGDPLVVTIDSPPGDGSVVVNPDGTVTYTPDAGFVGTDSFTYEACDADGACDTATVTVTVAAPLNDGGPGDDDGDSGGDDDNQGGGDEDLDGDGLAATGLPVVPLAALVSILLAAGGLMAVSGSRHSRRRAGR